MLNKLILTPEKRDILKSKMFYSFLWIPDEARTERAIDLFIDYLFSGTASVFYEIGNFDGIVGFYDIIPEYKCAFLARLWNRALWTPSLAKEIKAMISEFRQTLKMKRIGLATADERLGKFAKLMGFKAEGTQKNNFRFEGKFYTTYLYRLA